MGIDIDGGNEPLDPETMSDKEKVLAILQALRLPNRQYAVTGSAAMVVRDVPLERSIGGVDIFVSAALWLQLYEATEILWGVAIPTTDDPDLLASLPHLFIEFLNIPTVVRFAADAHFLEHGESNVVADAEQVEGYCFVPLSRLALAKQAIGRDKDLQDVVAIGEHLGVL